MSAQERPPSGGAARTAADRLLSLIGAFARRDGALTLSELAHHADLPLATAHRLLGELHAWGGLVQDEHGRYRLGNKFVEIASFSTRGFQLRERALPHLIELHRQSGLSVQLAARERDHVVYLEALRTTPNYSGENRIGGRLPLHAAGTGLVLLAYAPEEVVDEYLDRPLHAFTSFTPTDPTEVRALLAEIRTRRYALTARTVSHEVGTVAAPVFGPDQEVVASVNAIFLVRHHDPRPLIPQVLTAAAWVGRSLSVADGAPDPRTTDFRRRRARSAPPGRPHPREGLE
ncbi:MAG: IclR family transcriptional regulator [Microbacterium sp.]